MSHPRGIPSYRRHRKSGQAIVTLTDPSGQRRDVYLGPYNTVASRQEYARVIGEWEAAGQRLPAQDVQATDLTMSELILDYWRHAEEYYGFKIDRERGDAACLRNVLAVVRQMYGKTHAADFGPLALKACREKMIEKGWSRSYMNSQVDRLRRMFKWAAGEQLLPISIYQELQAVEGLRRGKTGARETAKVKPVNAEHVEAALPFMRTPVQGMVRFQQLTGCRPIEACLLRALDLDMSNPKCWVYRLRQVNRRLFDLRHNPGSAAPSASRCCTTCGAVNVGPVQITVENPNLPITAANPRLDESHLPLLSLRAACLELEGG